MFTKGNGNTISYKMQEHIGVISTANNGWTKEMNLIAWNDGEAKYEIRSWAPDHVRMSKGVTMSKDEVKVLKDLLAKVEC